MTKLHRNKIKYVVRSGKPPRVREKSSYGQTISLPKHINLVSHDITSAPFSGMPVSAWSVGLYNGLRRYGVEGEDAFLALAAKYLDVRKIPSSRLRFFPVERAQSILGSIAHDKQIMGSLDGVVTADSQGYDLANWYQFFVGRRFREGSGKFFTPRNVAAAMARLLPITPNAVIMDPTCGGGSFLCQASNRWQKVPCTIIGNDIDKMLVGLTDLVLALSLPPHHSFELHCCNIYDVSADLGALKGFVYAILANPPFSLPLDSVGFRSELFSAGYRNSDAVFLDVCLDLLAPEGRLICLLPHSIVANGDFEDLRKMVERNWDLCGIITLPEGVFYQTGNTTTRADIVYLKKRSARHSRKGHVYFANAPSVGYPLNSRSAFFGENSLNVIVTNSRVNECIENSK